MPTGAVEHDTDTSEETRDTTISARGRGRNRGGRGSVRLDVGSGHSVAASKEEGSSAGERDAGRGRGRGAPIASGAGTIEPGRGDRAPGTPFVMPSRDTWWKPRLRLDVLMRSWEEEQCVHELSGPNNENWQTCCRSAVSDPAMLGSVLCVFKHESVSSGLCKFRGQLMQPMADQAFFHCVLMHLLTLTTTHEAPARPLPDEDYKQMLYSLRALRELSKLSVVSNVY
jgi:hypothetical protein